MQFLELRVPPVLVVFILAVTMGLVTWLLPILEFSLPGKWWFAVGFCLLGGWIILLAAQRIIKARTTLDPRRPEKSRRLVIQGPYRYSRNPIYVGLLFVLFAFAIYLSNVIAFVLLPIYMLYMNRFQIQPEEGFMRQKFGDEYIVYVARVRRWL